MNPADGYSAAFSDTDHSALVHRCRGTFLDVHPTISQLHHSLRFQRWLIHDLAATQALIDLYRCDSKAQVSCEDFGRWVCSVLYISNSETANRYGSNLCYLKRM